MMFGWFKNFSFVFLLGISPLKVSAEELSPVYFCENPKDMSLSFTSSKGAKFIVTCEIFKIALEYIEKTESDKNFLYLLQIAASQTTTIKGLLEEFGKEEVMSFTTKEIKKAQKIYGKIWKQNMAISHLMFFSPTELIALGEQPPGPEKIGEFILKQNKVGEEMKELSLLLIQKALSEILTSTYNNFIETKN